MADRVELTVPSRGEFAKAVRMTASALVSRSALTYDEVDDVRIAAEEAFVYACDFTPDTGDVHVVFTIDETSFEIRVELTGDTRVRDDEESERRAAYATFILQSVCDRFEMSSDEVGSYMRVVKNLPPETQDADS